MQKVVLKLDLHDDREKQKCMKMVSRLTAGIDSITVDMKEKKLMLVGDIDLIQVVCKLRKVWRTDILSVGPAKEPEEKKDDAKEKDPNDQIDELVKLYKEFNPHMTTHYFVQSSEENPNACVIC